MQIIYNGLNYSTSQLIDVVAGRSLGNKYPNEVKQLLESMASNESHRASRGVPQKGDIIYEVNNNDALAAKVDVLTRKIDLLMGTSSGSRTVMSCRTCGEVHGAAQCPIASSSITPMEHVDFIGG